MTQLHHDLPADYQLVNPSRENIIKRGGRFCICQNCGATGCVDGYRYYGMLNLGASRTGLRPMQPAFCHNCHQSAGMPVQGPTQLEAHRYSDPLGKIGYAGVYDPPRIRAHHEHDPTRKRTRSRASRHNKADSPSMNMGSAAKLAGIIHDPVDTNWNRWRQNDTSEVVETY